MSELVRFLSGDNDVAQKTQMDPQNPTAKFVPLEPGQVLFGLEVVEDGSLLGTIYYDYKDKNGIITRVSMGNGGAGDGGGIIKTLATTDGKHESDEVTATANTIIPLPKKIFANLFSAKTQFNFPKVHDPSNTAYVNEDAAPGQSYLYGNGLHMVNPFNTLQDSWIRTIGKSGSAEATLELAMRDNASNEYIYDQIVARHYKADGTIVTDTDGRKREVVILGKEGESQFPGPVTSQRGFVGDVDGNAKSATKAKHDWYNQVIDSTYLSKIVKTTHNGSKFEITSYDGRYTPVGSADAKKDVITIPGATTTLAGLVTTGDQTITGNKTINSSGTLTIMKQGGFIYSGIQEDKATNKNLPIWFSTGTANGTPNYSTKLTYNPSTGTVTAKKFAGPATSATYDAEGGAIHDKYLKRAGGTMTGALKFADNIYNAFGDDVEIGSQNAAGKLNIHGKNGATGIVFAPYSGSTSQTISIDGAGVMTITGTVKTTLKGNADTATKLKTARNFNITDSSAAYSGPNVSFNGSADVTLHMPDTFAGTLKGNADTATKLATARTLWGQSFNGTANISGNMTGVGNVTSTKTNTYTLGTSSNLWKAVYATTFYGALSGNANTATKLQTARSFHITDSSATYNGANASFNGTGDVTLHMPSTFAGTLKGNADSATKATWLQGPDTRTVNDAPSVYMPKYPRGIYPEFKQNSSLNSIPGEGTYSYVVTYVPWKDSLGGRPVQMSFNTGALAWRSATSDSAWGAWKTLIHSSNYTNYTVKKDGTGATGTWGINITGNAATATQAQSALKDGDLNEIATTYLKRAGGTMTGDISFATIATWPTASGETYPIKSKGLSWSGSSDWAKIFFRVNASDQGHLVINLGDSTDEKVIFAANTTDYVNFEVGNRLFYPTANNTGSIGTSSHKWANIYATTFNGALSGNANTATKLQTARSFHITDSSATYNGVSASFNGTAGVTLHMPDTFAGTLKGNADTATKLKTARTLWGQSFNGSANVTGNMSSVGNILSATNNTYNLGSSTNKWKNIYATTFHGALDGKATSAGSADMANQVTHVLTIEGQSYDGSTDVAVGNTVFYIVGNSTDTKAGTWTGTDRKIKSYYNGLTIIYVPKVDGASTTTLNLNGLGAKTCYYSNTSKLTTHFEKGTPILLTYIDGYWRRADYDSNTNTQLRVYRQKTSDSAYNKEYPLLVSRTQASGIGTANSDGSYTSIYGVMNNDTAKIPTLNVHTGAITATSFKGTASNAINDVNGAKIDETYLKKSGGTMTGALNFANNTYNKFGDDVEIGDRNTAGKLYIHGKNGATGIVFAPYTGSTSQTISIDGAGVMTITGTVKATLSGNASTATTLKTARNFHITDSSATYNGPNASFNGSADVTLHMPSTFAGTLKGNADSSTIARSLGTDNTIKLYAQYSNEINFGGTNAITTIYFGRRATDSRPIPTKFVFGGSTGTATLVAATFQGALSGNATTATTLKTARKFHITDSSATYNGPNASFNGSADITLHMPSTFAGSLKGNADTATNADKLDGYHANAVYKAATHTINNYSSTNGWLRVATITISGSSLSTGGFTAIFSNRECLDSSSFILTVAIRRNSTTAASCQAYVTPIGTSAPREILVRSNDGVNFYVYFKSVLNSWTTYYNVTKIMSENNVTFENVGLPASNLIAGRVLNVTASRGGYVYRAQNADAATTATKWATSRNFQVDLALDNPATVKVDGSKDVILPVTGILATKHGGTGNSSHTANRLVWTETATKLTSGYHYADTTHVGVNTTTKPGQNFYVNGTSYLNGNTTINGQLYMALSNAAITWNQGTYWQRMITEDDSASGAHIFKFQVSSNSGSSWTDILRLANNGQIRVQNNVGGIYKLQTTASTTPAVQVISDNQDSSIFKVCNGTAFTDSWSCGFDLVYNGTGADVNNLLTLYAGNYPNTTGRVVGWSVNQAGQMGIRTTPSTSYALNINGNTHTNGIVYINNSTEAGKDNAGALIVGPTGGVNLGIDSNEITARNNKAVSTLYLNPHGGLVQIGAGGLRVTGQTRTDGPLLIGSATNGRDKNYIAFYGTTSDGAGSFNHTYIGENLYGGTESSELVLFKGADMGGAPENMRVTNSTGPDRIRHIAAGHLFQAFRTTSAKTNGSFATVCAAADDVNLVNVFEVNNKGVIVYGVGTDTQNYPAKVTFKVKDTVTSQEYGAYIAAYNDHAATTYGSNFVINSGGNAFFGAGESAANLYALKTKDTGENMYLTADGNVYLYANANTVANRIGIVLDTSGNILPQKANGGAEQANSNALNIGANTNYFANMYTRWMYVNAGGAGTDGGISLWSNTSSGYFIAMRTTASLGTHGYVTNDYATYFSMHTNSNSTPHRGWIFRETRIGLNVASIDTRGWAQFNGICLNRANDTGSNRVVGSSKIHHGFLSWYGYNWKNWVTYMSDSTNNSCPTGGKPSTLGKVTSWALRSVIQNSSGYGWVWEASAITTAAEPDPTTKPTALMALDSNFGQLRIAQKGTTNANTQTAGLVISSAENGGSADVAIELWRGTNASWQMRNSGGVLTLASNYTSSAQGSYSQPSLTLDYNTGAGSIPYLAIGQTARNTSYRLYVNGTSYLGGNTIIKGHLTPDADSTYNVGSTSKHWRYGYFDGMFISTKTGFTSTTGNAGVDGVFIGSGYMEMVASTPFIDFHNASSTADYSARIISDGANRLTINQGGTPASLSYNRRSINPLLRVVGTLYASSNIESAEYFLNNRTSAGGGFCVYGNNNQYARLYISTIGTAGNGTNKGTNGVALLILGNSTAVAASGGANNARGLIRMYGANANYTDVYAQANGNRTLYLPNYAGNMYLVHAGDNQAVGGAQQPVYIAANGRVTACTSYTDALDGRYVNVTGDTMTGTLRLGAPYQATANSRYSDCALEIREAGRVGSAQSGMGYAPRIGFHWSGRVAASLAFHSDGAFYFRNQADTGNAPVYASTFYGNLSGNASSANYLNINNSANCAHGLQYIQTSAQTAGGDLPTATWWHVIKMNHGIGDIYYKRLLAFNFWTGNDIRTGNADGDGKVDAWYKVWCQGNSVTGAVWNDYAECRESDTQEAGYVLAETGKDNLVKTTERLQHFAGVSSDTWGFSQGETEKAKTPIAVAGRVLVYPYQDRNNYQPGDCVCAAPGGTVDIMTREEVIQYPDRIVGTVSCVPDYEEWGGGELADRDPVKVDGRIWIKVR